MKDVAHVVKRGGVWQYVRRVPQAVRNNPVGWETYFKSQTLFRRSLRAGRLVDMVSARDRTEREFETLVAKAIGREIDLVIAPPSILGPIYSGSLVTGLASKIDKAPPARTLREVVNAYIVHRQHPPKTAKEVRHALDVFETLVGNRRLDELEDSDFLRFVEHLSAKTVGGRSKGSIPRPMARATVKKHLTFLHSAIGFAIKRRWFDGANPAANIDVDAFVVPVDKIVSPDKRRFNVEELNALFSYPWYAGCRSEAETHSPGDYLLDGSEYWSGVVAAYSGARCGELGGMMLSEVMLDTALPHFRIRGNENRRTKSGRARSVPILDALLALGFDRYVERLLSRGEKRLFPDWHIVRNGWANAPLIRAFNRTVIPATIGSNFIEGARREVTFHGLRGSFKWMLLKNGVAKHLVDEIIGHRQSDLDSSYLGDWTIDDTYPVAHKADYPGLVIPGR